MLILVGVTINVALKGDLFESAEKATTETEKYAILEQIIEMAKWNNNGEVDVEGTETSVKAKYPGLVWDEAIGKLTIAGKKGTYNYKLSKREITIWEEKEPKETFTITIGELGEKQLLTGNSNDVSGASSCSASEFWGENVSEELKNSMIEIIIGNEDASEDLIKYKTWNISCSDPNWKDLKVMFDETGGSPESGKYFVFCTMDEGATINLGFMDFDNDVAIANDNYTDYADISFTFSMAE